MSSTITQPAPAQPPNRAAMLHAKTLVAVVLTLKTIGASLTGRRIRPARRLRPVDPEKAASAAHLVVMIDRDSVMNGSSRESIIPRRRSVVEICSGVARQVNALPPQIHVQLIGLKRPASVSAGADQRPGSVISEAEVSGFGGRQRGESRSFAALAGFIPDFIPNQSAASSQGPGFSAGRFRTAAPNCSSGRKSRYDPIASGKIRLPSSEP